MLTMRLFNVTKDVMQLMQCYTKDPCVTLGDFLKTFKSSQGVLQSSSPYNVDLFKQPCNLSENILKRTTKHSFRTHTRSESISILPESFGSAPITGVVNSAPHKRKASVNEGEGNNNAAVSALESPVRVASPAKKQKGQPISTSQKRSIRKNSSVTELSDMNDSTTDTPAVETQDTATTTQSPASPTTSNRKCFYCSTKTTPMWRRGPEGAGTLCNACGVKWKSGKILHSKYLCLFHFL